MKNRILLGIFFSILTFALHAKENQDTIKHCKYIGIELGAYSIQPEITDMDFIRGETATYYNQGEAVTNLRCFAWTDFLGIKVGMYSRNNKFRYRAGLRFSYLHASLGKSSYWSSNPDFFYLLYNQVGTTTEFLKIKEINQVSEYLGVPLEINYFPFNPHRFQLGFKIGFEWNYRLHTKTDITFFNDAMNVYEKDITTMLGNPGSYTAALFGGVMLHIGKPSKIGVTIESCTPSVFLTHEKKGIMSPVAGFGLQLSLQIPLK